MQIILKENQYKHLLMESTGDNINNELKSAESFAKTVLKRAGEDMGLNLKFFFTWGAAIGGFIVPLNGFIEHGGFEINEIQTISILAAAGIMLFDENSPIIRKMLLHIKEEGIMETFTSVLEKGYELKSAFIDFMQSLNLTLYAITNIMSYAFIIPILPMIWDISQSGVSESASKEIALRVIMFGVVSISGNMIREVIRKLIIRFKG